MGSRPRGIVRRLRLLTGLVLFTYLLTHYANHALGLVSIEALEQGRTAFLTVWRNPLGQLVLYGSLAIHLGLAVWSIYQRPSLRMPVWQAVQLLVGLMIPPLLAIHIIGTRLADVLYSTRDSYTYVLLSLWVFSPLSGLQQAIVLVVAWLHGCIGLHCWLHLKAWYPRAVSLLFAAALLVPLLGLLGFAVAGRDVARLAADPAWLEEAAAAIGFPSAEQVAFLYDLEHSLWAGFALLLAGTLAARGLRRCL